MTEISSRALPHQARLVREELRLTGHTLRRGGVTVAVALVASVILAALGPLLSGAGGVPIEFSPWRYYFYPSAGGVILALLVWRDDEPFGAGYGWTLPVDRRRRVLIRVLAGWLWLLAAVSFFVLWQAGLTLGSGGAFFPELSTFVGPGPEARGALVPGTAIVRWTPSAWLWVVPLAGPTLTYLLTTAVRVGVRRPAHWIAGALVLTLLFGVIGRSTGDNSVGQFPGRALRSVLDGPYGLGTVMDAQATTPRVEIVPSAEPTVQWRVRPPDFRAWGLTTACWLLMGLATVSMAARRHRESRRE